MKIRPYNEDDDLREIVREAVNSRVSEHYSKDEQQHLQEVIPGMNEDFAAKEEYIYYVAVDDSQIMGLAGFQKETGTVSGVFVDPEHMGQGVGTMLLNKLEDSAKDNGLDKLRVPSSLDAEEFYSKNGYKTLKTEKHNIEGKEIGQTIMEKPLL